METVTIWQNNESDIPKVGDFDYKNFYGIDDYYKKYSRTKSEFIPNSSIWFISIIKHQDTLILEQILWDEMT